MYEEETIQDDAEDYDYDENENFLLDSRKDAIGIQRTLLIVERKEYIYRPRIEK